MSTRIEDYALIGDCKSAALVARNGSIDWLCWPRFDSEACFAALLGTRDHGRWLIAPQQQARVTRRYRPNTLILETHFETADGAATLIDFMPFRGEHSEIVRLVVGTRGKLKMHTELILRFGYGAVVPWVTRLENGALRAIAGPDMAVLRTPVRIMGKDMTTVGEFVIAEGETIPFVLTYSRSHKTLPETHDPTTALQDTEKFWTEWAAICRPAGEWSDAVRRSVITLKALTYGPTGGIVAAPTTSLPEQLGGERNWDYRYCWLRDATLTLLTVMHAGYYEEAQSWREWLLRAVAGSPEQLQIMYGIGGERRLIEWVADWLPGYEQSAPVRIGNAAHTQRQLDVFGETMDVAYQARRCGLSPHESDWDVQLKFLEHLTEIWREPDQGIWEMRGPAQHFTYSKAMAWVAFDRGIKSIETFGLEGPLDDWRKLRDEICEDVCERGFDKQAGNVRAGLWLGPARRQSVAVALHRLFAGHRPAHRRYHRGNRTAARARRLRHALQHRAGRRCVAARRGRVPRLQLLAGRRLYAAGPLRRRRAAVSPSRRPVQRRRPVERGIRSARQAPGRQFPAGLLASGADQQRL